MRIEKQVECLVDVEVDVSLEDITDAIAECVDTERSVLRGVTNCHRFLQAIPDEIIAGLNDHQRETVFNAMTVQVNRFAPKAEGGKS